jgi:hypothetical protein
MRDILHMDNLFYSGYLAQGHKRVLNSDKTSFRRILIPVSEKYKAHTNFLSRAIIVNIVNSQTTPAFYLLKHQHEDHFFFHYHPPGFCHLLSSSPNSCWAYRRSPQDACWTVPIMLAALYLPRRHLLRLLHLDVCLDRSLPFWLVSDTSSALVKQILKRIISIGRWRMCTSPALSCGHSWFAISTTLAPSCIVIMARYCVWRVLKWD